MVFHRNERFKIEVFIKLNIFRVVNPSSRIHRHAKQSTTPEDGLTTRNILSFIKTFLLNENRV